MEKKLAKYKHHENYSEPLEIIFCCASCHTWLNNERRFKEQYE